ncbi:hypothetical protein [Halobacterium sp. KA-6]|uniref:hypothetical protein n=1 Tax=Halobacterium sp. KA-6 TaxID=2896368 RepID=UPI001E646437|nr:hypothetical protein [Halobacterium sp. KA-6]MCD2204517.1 hypothetical protein [Halobacterium sp. KA-6]
MTERGFKRCVRSAVREFDRYDRDVDVVTCWEVFLSDQYGYHFRSFNFDRFPNILDERVNPSFTAYFNDEYGIVFETYHDRIAKIDEEVSRLKKLSNCELATDRGRDRRPETLDIALLVDADEVQTVGHSLKEEIEAGNLDCDSNIILLDFDFIGRNDRPRYRFRRSSILEDNFEDAALPGGRKLSNKLSQQGQEFENIQIPTNEDFSEFKATGMITNKAPSELYLACRLWNGVFIEFLSDDELEAWKTGSSRGGIDKIVEASEIREKINQELIPGANVDDKWVIDALEYLAICGVAEKSGDGEFNIEFKNLRDKKREYNDTSSARSKVSDLAWLLSEWHCENRTQKSREELAEFIAADSVDSNSLDGLGKAELTDF